MCDEKNASGWAVAWAAFTLAVFAWGIGFYGPSVFLQTIHAARGWEVSQISAAITFHFLLSAVLITALPNIHRRYGIATTTFAGAVFAALGLLGWSSAWQPWHLFAAAVPSAVGWATTSGAALNAIVARWFDRDRPKAIGLAFNGASVGGVLFVPLWIFLIAEFGFRSSAVMVGAVTVLVVGALSLKYFRRSPQDLDITSATATAVNLQVNERATLSRVQILRMPKFLTLSAAFSLGLFAQIGLLAHLIVRLAPEVGVEIAGLLVSAATICAVIGRTLAGWWIGDRDRRIAAAANFAIQIIGVLLLILGSGWPLLSLGCLLFGLGIGNLTSLPPLIVQKEFNRQDVVTVVALIVAINQAVFAFAPAVVGALRDMSTTYTVPFALIAAVQTVALVVVLLGRASLSRAQPSA